MLSEGAVPFEQPVPPTTILLEQVGDPLVAAASEVLETMFFTIVESADQPPGGKRTSAAEAGTEEPSPAQEPGAEYGGAAEVRFGGAHNGRFRVALSAASARANAANFMGILDPQELKPVHVEQVMCEFANMVCGATLSRLAPHEIFRLETPHPCAPPAGTACDGSNGPVRPAPLGMPGAPALARRLITDNGWVDLYWCWGEAA